MGHERTLLVIKPDGVKKKVVGEIVSTFEKEGLEIVALKMMKLNREFVEVFLGNDKKWLTKMGEKAIKAFDDVKVNPYQTFGSNDPLDIGRQVKEWLIEFWISGKVVPIIISGDNAVNRVREIVGDTIPKDAKYGTIRNRFAPLENAYTANSNRRCLHNIIHASGTIDEAEREINVWFKPDEIY